MSLEARYNQNHAPEILEKLKNLDDLEQIATAAGHGYAALGLKHNADWVQVEIDPENCRPGYDLAHIRTFSPDLIRALLFELSEARKALAETN